MVILYYVEKNVTKICYKIVNLKLEITHNCKKNIVLVRFENTL